MSLVDGLKLLRPKTPEQRVQRTLYEMELGKRFFRNPTPVSEQLRGRYFIARNRMAKPFERGEEGRKSQKVGFRSLGRIATSEQMAPVQTALDREFSIARPDDYYYKGSLAMRSLLFALEPIPELRTLLTPEVLTAVRQYYGCNFSLYNVSTWRTWSIPPAASLEDEAYSNNWHVDCRRIDMLKVFITGSDVTEDDGPTHVLSREWTKQVVRRGFKHRRDYQLPVDFIENPEHMVKLTGPAGTALLCNTNFCFHRASIPAPGHRRDLIELRFVSAPEFSLEMPDQAKLPWRDRITS